MSQRWRRSKFELLENRLALSGNPFGQNELQPLDVSRDGEVSPLDALQIINVLNRSTSLSVDPQQHVGSFIDVNGDGSATAIDALQIINALNRNAPVLAVTLQQDTAPVGRLDLRYDLISQRYALSIKASIQPLTDQVIEIRVGRSASWVDISDQFVDSEALLDEAALASLAGIAINDGSLPIAIRMNRESNPISFELTIDRQGPVAVPALDDLLLVAPNYIDIEFTENVARSEAANTAFSLQQTGGEALEPLNLEFLPQRVRIRYPQRLSDSDYRLSFDGTVTDLAGNIAEPFDKSFLIVDPAGIASLSPSNGESLVSLLRETVVRFDEPVDPSTVTSNTFQVLAGGELVPGTIHVSSSGMFAVYYYEQPLMPSTEYRVLVNGDLILGVDGMRIDADGDNVPGGTSISQFRTLPLTNIPNTSVFGYVYDSYNRDSQGNDVPIVGAKVYLDSSPNIFAITDERGFFELGLQDFDNDGTPDGLPTPDFFVHIDGSTAVNAPSGSKYATLGKPFHSVPGQRKQLRMDGSPVDVDPNTPGDQFHVYLPPMSASDIVTLPTDRDAVVGFGPSVLGDAQRLEALFPRLTAQQRALLPLTQVTYPAGAALTQDGEIATQATVIAVNPERLPAPLPPGVDPQLVISIQAGVLENGTPQFNLAGGSTNFDIPAPVQFPNLDGLPAGSKSLLWSFDHDAGRWVVNGTGTVTADGTAIVSDPGVGVLAPGWHFADQGARVELSAREFCRATAGPKPSTFDADLELIKEVLLFGGSLLKSGPRAINLIKDIATGTAALDDIYEAIPLDEADASDLISGGVGVLSLATLRREATSKLKSVVGTLSILTGVNDVWDAYEGAMKASKRLEEYREFFARCVRDVTRLDTQMKALADEVDALRNEIADSLARTQDFWDELQDTIERIEDILQDLDTGSQLDPNDPLDKEKVRENQNQPAAPNRGNPGQPPSPTVVVPPRSTFDGGRPVGGGSPVDEIVQNREDQGTPVLIIPPPSGIASDVGDTLASALPLNLETNSGLAIDQSIGDNAYAALDVDIYRFDATAGDFLNFEMIRLHRGLNHAVLRLFDSEGNELAGDASKELSEYPRIEDFNVLQSGTYFLGVSAFANDQYQPTVAGSGGDAFFEGDYRLAISRLDGAPTKAAKLDQEFMRLLYTHDWISNDKLFGAGSEMNRLAANADRLSQALIESEAELLASPAFLLVEDLETASVQRLRVGEGGKASVVVAPDNEIRLSLYSPLTGQVAVLPVAGDASGAVTHVDMLMRNQDTDLATDLDDDLLSDLAENVIGTDPENEDSDGDGVLDGIEVMLGSNPLDGVTLLTGVISSLSLNQVVHTIDAHDQLAFVGGSDGVAVVDVTEPERPILLGEWNTANEIIDIAVDVSNNYVYLATGNTLEIVDYSDTMNLRHVRSHNQQVEAVLAFEGYAIAGTNSGLKVIDPESGMIVSETAIPGTGQISLSRAGNLVLAFRASSDTFSAIDIESLNAIRVRDSLNLPVAASNVGIFGTDQWSVLAGVGLVTVDHSNPDDIQLISGPDIRFESRAVSFNGNRTAVVATDTDNTLAVYNLSDLDLTAEFLTAFSLPGRARDVVIHRGMALAIAGDQISLVNYSLPDRNRVSPTVDLSIVSPDADPAAPGFQVIEGQAIRLLALANDDSQVAYVEFLHGEQVVFVDGSYPFEASLIPTSGANEFRARAYDTGGNFAVSPALQVTGSPDTFAPTVVSLSPVDGATRFEGAVNYLIEFSEPMSSASVSIDHFRLISVGTQEIIQPSQVRSLARNTVVEVVFDSVPRNDYKLTLDAADITDVAGNPLGSEAITFDLVVAERRDPGETTASALDLGILGAGVSYTDSFNDADSLDVYSFELENPASIAARIVGQTSAVDVRLFRDLNADGVLTSSERYGSAFGGSGVSVLQDLLPGKYFLQVSSSASTSYDLQVEELIRIDVLEVDPGSTPGNALNFGSLTSVVSATDMLMRGVDDSDVYRFTLAEPRVVEFSVSGQNDGISAELYRDLDGDGLFDSNERFAARFGGSGMNERQDLLPGEYFLLVDDSFSTPYTLTITPGSIIPLLPTDPGTTIATALDLGILSAAVSRTDMLMRGVDDADVYRFTIDVARVVEFEVTGQNDGVSAELYRDLDGDGLFDSNERFATRFGGSGINDSQDLLPGEYFLLVDDSFSTPYTLTVTPGSIIPVLGQDPGSTPATALELGSLSAIITRSDMLMRGVDDADVYRFNINAARVVEFEVTGQNDGISAELYRDLNGDGQLDSNERFAARFGGSGISDQQDLLPGEYYLTLDGSFSTPYSLTLRPLNIIPTLSTDPGSNFTTAFNVGVLNNTAVLSDMLMNGVDSIDVFRFELDRNASLQLRLENHNDSITMRLFQDSDGDGEADSNEQLAARTGGSGITISSNLASGVYFVMLDRSLSTPYSLSFVIS